MARNIVAVVFVAIALIATLGTLYDPETEQWAPSWEVVLCLAITSTLLVIQIAHFSSPQGLQANRRTFVLLGVQALLVYAPFLVIGQAWVGMPGFLAGSVLLALPSRPGWTLFAGIVISMGLVQRSLSAAPEDVTYVLVSTVITGLVVFGLSRLASLVRQLHDARGELARLAVTQERLRFSRDLHDLLGYSLSAITLKSELTRRLVIRQPNRAVEELGEILQLSRQALADVRSVAVGYRDLSLDAEARSACSVLGAADIRVTLDGDPGPLPDAVNTVLATVLREGVTNVLRHSKAATCQIDIGRHGDLVRLTLVNDGVGVGDHLDLHQVTPRSGGSGLDNLRTRVEDLGGALRAGVDDNGWFELTTEVPLVAAPVHQEPAESGARAS